MEPQIFDQVVKDGWSTEPWRSSLDNATSDLWSNYSWLNDSDLLAYNIDDMPALDSDGSGFDLSSSLSPPDFGLPSPVSDATSIKVEDPFDQKTVIDPWVMPNDFDAMEMTSPLSEGNSPVIKLPELSSSPESSGSTSPRDNTDETETKKQPKRDRRQNSRPKSPICKRQNAHNLIEKRYRNNLNSKIQSLRDSIPAFRSAAKENDDSEDGDANDCRKAQKCNKGVILDKAIEYIAELEKEVERRAKENASLQLMIDSNLASYLYAGGIPTKGVQSRTFA